MGCSQGRRFRSCDVRLLPGFLLSVLTPLIIVGCERQAPETPTGGPSPSTTAGSAAKPDSSRAITPRATIVRYRRSFVSSPRRLAILRDSLDTDGFREVLKINRLDQAHIHRGDSLVIPTLDRAEGRHRDSLACSPFPPTLDSARELPKLLLISIRVQAFAAYERGTLVRWGPTCTGRRDTPTPPGLYHTNWKARERRSTVNSEWLLSWYVNLDNLLGVSLHQYDLPGRPASHSCVRLLEEDARWLYGWSDQWKLAADGSGVAQEGTPVMIFGSYAYGKRPPWKRLPEDPGATAVHGPELEDAVSIALRRF
jgi:hypothetical protein